MDKAIIIVAVEDNQLDFYYFLLDLPSWTSNKFVKEIVGNCHFFQKVSMFETPSINKLPLHFNSFTLIGHHFEWESLITNLKWWGLKRDVKSCLTFKWDIKTYIVVISLAHSLWPQIRRNPNIPRFFDPFARIWIWQGCCCWYHLPSMPCN